jgi:hypothetical protein
MTAINLPNSPSVNDVFTSGDSTWKWNGSVWSIVRTGVGLFNGTTAFDGFELIKVDETISGQVSVFGYRK